MTSALPIQHGDGARMDSLADCEADLVFTGPPYWPPEMEARLCAQRSQQTDIAEAEATLLAFARTLRPVFKEACRVLKPGRALVIQTKDIRYGDFLIPLSDAHVSVAASCGFHLVTRVIWIPDQREPWRVPGFARSPDVGSFRTLDGEHFIILAGAKGLDRRMRLPLAQTEAMKLVSPLWRINARRRHGDHPYATPRPVARQIIGLFTQPGDLVVDPFAGGGSILECAIALGRRALGWDIDLACRTAAHRPSS